MLLQHLKFASLANIIVKAAAITLIAMNVNPHLFGMQLNNIAYFQMDAILEHFIIKHSDTAKIAVQQLVIVLFVIIVLIVLNVKGFIKQQ